MRFHNGLLLLGFLAVTSGLAFADEPAISTGTYQWKSVAIGGGGFVPGIITHPTVPGLMYARTDVGGAYRWDKDRWVALTDWVSPGDGNLLGCESIAVDPQNPDRVYLALGTYTNSWAGNGAIVRSDNRGRSFMRTDMPFKMGGNDPGRSVGERLVVDPHDDQILFFGSRAAGLWRSADGARTWKKIDAFPAVATSPAACEPEGTEWANGISFVKFIPGTGRRGTPSSVIYAGVCTQQTSLFRSTDAGVSWLPVTGAPTGLRPNHMVVSSTGQIFISYGDQAGPNGISDGAIYWFDPHADRWTDITPVKPSKNDSFGYGALSVDARNPTVLMASSLDRWGHGDAVFRTTDGGEHWSAQTVGGNHDKSLFDVGTSPWSASMAPHWLGDIEIDPFDSAHAMFVTGFGIWSTHNATNSDFATKTRWTFTDTGLEEVVPLELISPGTGAHLISVIGDFDGFTHDNLDVSPKRGRHEPSVGTSSGLDFAELKPKFVVRAGGHGQGFYSEDGGETWTAFASAPADAKGGGHIAVSSNGGTIVWKPDGTDTFESTDLGKSWNRCAGLARPAWPIADRVDPNRFYAVDQTDGQLWLSQNAGVTFATSALKTTDPNELVRAVPGYAGHMWICTQGQLFQSIDGGRTVKKITTVSSASKIGFGKSAPGQTYPALFLAGEVNGVAGLFRSDDVANSWQRINDASHQYGSVGIVIGDPRIYGRVYIGTSGRGIIYGDLRNR